MVTLLASIVMRMRLKDKLKRIGLQSKNIEKKVQSSLIVCSEECLKEESFFLKLAELLDIDPKHITVVVVSKKEQMNQKPTTIKTYFFSRKSIGFFGHFPDALTRLFDTHFDLQFNFLDSKSVFLELVSASFASTLRIGFSRSNQLLNDLILDLDPKDDSLFFKETHIYLKAILK
jgi:hypothetical protein